MSMLKRSDHFHCSYILAKLTLICVVLTNVSTLNTVRCGGFLSSPARHVILTRVERVKHQPKVSSHPASLCLSTSLPLSLHIEVIAAFCLVACRDSFFHLAAPLPLRPSFHGSTGSKHGCSSRWELSNSRRRCQIHLPFQIQWRGSGSVHASLFIHSFCLFVSCHLTSHQTPSVETQAGSS